MSILAERPDILTSELEGMSAREVRARQDFVESCLNHRLFSVRWAAALALGKSGVGEKALLARLLIERNELVITEICDSLSAVGERESAKALEFLAINDRSSLVRSYALMAIGDILQKEAIPFLVTRLASDPAVRVQATLRVVLLALGVVTVLDGIRKNLRSKNQVTRRLVANLLGHYRPRRKRQEIVGALKDALRVEEERGASGDLKSAIEQLGG